VLKKRKKLKNKCSKKEAEKKTLQTQKKRNKRSKLVCPSNHKRHSAALGRSKTRDTTKKKTKKGHPDLFKQLSFQTFGTNPQLVSPTAKFKRKIGLVWERIPHKVTQNPK